MLDEFGKRQGPNHGEPCRTLVRNLDFILRTMGRNLGRNFVMGIPCADSYFEKFYLYTNLHGLFIL